MKKNKQTGFNGVKWKQQHPKERKRINQKERNQTSISEKTQTFRRNKPYYLNKPSSTWKIPTFLLLLSLMIIILIIPTLIVVPFVTDGQNESIALDTDQEIVIKPTPSPSSFSVSVMRMNSDEIEDIPLEEYVIGVVSSEMSPDFEMEALKAQGLAARTFIVNHILNENSTEKANVTDTTDDQVYKNEDELRKLWGNDYNKNMARLTEAVVATEGEILTYNNAPIFPAFFSTSNGYTENSEDYWENELPHLRSVPSPWDKESPKFLDQQIFTINQVEEALGVDLPSDTPLKFEITRTESKRVNQLNIADNQFSGREVREKLKLQSNDFTIEQNNDHLIFTTKGYGHGIGMSQYGANGMAKEGKDYQEIVKYYYKDIEISTITETAPTLVAK